ncbi:MAG: hypothetical protein ACRELB_02000 [Polyangiaceae bacterium]
MQDLGAKFAGAALSIALWVTLWTFVLFLVTRWFWLWYWKVNHRLQALDAIRAEVLHLRQLTEQAATSRVILEQIRDSLVRQVPPPR